MKKVIKGYVLKSTFGYVQEIEDSTSGHSGPSVRFCTSVKDAMLFKTQKDAEYTKNYFGYSLYKIRLTEEVSRVI